MVEMSELADILHHADSQSLIILDEIGRGTSTYDGISVAWSTLEWIVTQIRARTFFATHYHELIHLSQSLPLLANAHMAVAPTQAGRNRSLRFLYELREGPTNESFGIHVAQLAGLPKPVIERAWKVLEELETQNQAGEGKSFQLHLFDHRERASREEDMEFEAEPEVPPVPHPVLQELGQTDINQLTPVQALNFVVRLKDLTDQGA
jgi:DNA mismatch repair protein MutS